MNLDEQLQYSAEDIGENALSAGISDERQRKPIQVYIENARDDSIGGFTIPLPTTKESLQPWLEAIGTDGFAAADIAIRGVRSSIPGLEEVLRSVGAERASFDELNYLASKISGLDEYRMDLFIAALEANYHCDNIQDLINVP
ncbi:antirestriction protein ArdA, partial [Ruminococcaceae bacterium OttesenSCG-928-I18]|nr:antirestriction protein ArdA [Ruminococcaceae bacterium OttesenSCG-928-I18]